MSEEVKIVENAKVPTGSTMLFAFPDVGLVGVIAASHLVDELGLTEVAYVDSGLLPPVVVLHEGLPHSTIRIFGNQNLLLAVSETPVPAEIIYPIVNALIDWGTAKKAKLMISLSGVPLQEREEAKELKVFVAASNSEMLKLAKIKGMETLLEGYMVGPQAVIMQRCVKSGLPALTLLGQCYLNYPDPEAAAEVLKGLSLVLSLKIDVSKLIEKGEEIRLRARDTMRRTQQELPNMNKTQEYEIPMYVS